VAPLPGIQILDHLTGRNFFSTPFSIELQESAQTPLVRHMSIYLGTISVNSNAILSHDLIHGVLKTGMQCFPGTINNTSITTCLRSVSFSFVSFLCFHLSPTLFLQSQKEAKRDSDHSAHHAYNNSILYQYLKARTKHKEKKI
jgi:hypothetical protein